MAQHFLLSKASRGLSAAKVRNLSDDQAWQLLVDLRWPAGEQVCPDCGSVRKHYFVKCRKKWRCADCNHNFSVTSRTVFANHKLPIQQLLEAIVIYVQAVKGISAAQMSRHLDINYKTAFVLLHKLRDAIGRSEDLTPLQGEVEVDGGYFLNAVRPENRLEDRQDRRLAANRNPNEMALVVMRERGAPGEGAVRTRVIDVEGEHDPDLLPQMVARLHDDATVIADEHPGYNPLAGHYPMQRVNHGQNYVGPNGENQNQAESYFARTRRMMIGQIHKCDRKYILDYGIEIAWREDMRRRSNKDQFLTLTGAVMRLRPSRDWTKYWQGNHRADYQNGAARRAAG